MRSAERLCKRRGVRLTPIRRQVLELIWGSHMPVTAYELLSQLKDAGRDAAPPTVYRALGFLIEQGLIHRLETLNAYIGCGAPGESHGGQFLICTDCGAVAELDDEKIGTLVNSSAREVGFRPVSQVIEVRGQCTECHPSRETRHA